MISEKLSNKEHREKAWKIYLSDKPTSIKDETLLSTPSTNEQKETTPNNGQMLYDIKASPSLSINTEASINSSNNDNRTSKSIYNDTTTLDEIDKKLLNNIEKKLKLVQKVQSDYKRHSKHSEIETVNELLKSSKKTHNKLKASHHSNHNYHSRVANAIGERITSTPCMSSAPRAKTDKK
jgi:hypothetical protein